MREEILPRGEPGAVGHVRALDGLRAVAVILVFGFHLRIAGFAAGWLGVDMFFVLSGFLITSLLLAEMRRDGRIGLAAFWARRARRLLPALVLLLLVVVAVTHFTATPSERSSIRGDLLATTAYAANWRFISTSSYFVNTGAESPLQHTWSLAIEEQFYLVWPLLLAGSLLLLRRARPVVAGLAGVGVVASVVTMGLLFHPGSVERAYMGTDARIFEPLIGALGAVLVVTPRSRAILDRAAGAVLALGSIGIVAGLAVIRPDTALYYEGGALLFSLATLMVLVPLWTGRGGVAGRAVAWGPIAWLGVVSYGVYLWHWPLILWLEVPQAHGLGALGRSVAVVAGTLGVAAASYYVIERPIREGLRSSSHGLTDRSRRPLRVLAAVPIVLLSVAGVSMAATAVPALTATHPGVTVVMLVGDSVPMRLEPSLERAGKPLGWRFVSAARGACPVTGEVTLDPTGTVAGGESDQCPSVIGAQDSIIRQAAPDLVLWWDRWSISDFTDAAGAHVRSGTSHFWQLRAQALAASVRRLTSNGAIVVFVATEPPGVGRGNQCSDLGCAEWKQFQIDHYVDITSRWNRMMKAYAQDHPRQAAFISVTDTVCRVDVAPCDDTIDGVPARPEMIHYAGPGVDKVIGALLPELGAIASARSSLG